MGLRGGDKFVRFLLLRLLLALAIGVPAGSASALNWPSEQQLGSTNTYERLRAWRQVEHLFSIEKLSPTAFVRYALALAQDDCDLAQEILWVSFLELEPEFAARARHGQVARQWPRSILPYRFPENAFCKARRDYVAVAARLSDEGISSLPETAVLGFAERRNTDIMPSKQAYLINTLQVLFNAAHKDNPDAIRFILEQDRIGRYVRLTDEQRLSLLLRLARLGQAGPKERAQAMKLAREMPLSTVAAARAYAAREIAPEYERWQAFQARLRALQQQ